MLVQPNFLCQWIFVRSYPCTVGGRWVPLLKVWAFTKVLVDDPPPMTATSAAAVRTPRSNRARLTGRNIRSWSISLSNGKKSEAAKITACGHQELGNIAWSFAREPSIGPYNRTGVGS